MEPLQWCFTVLLVISSLRPPMATGDTYATVCGKTGKYKANSTYQQNVQSVTKYLFNEATFSGGNGFATRTEGTDPDRVYGLGICRGDTPDNVTCYECLSSASVEASTLCPDDKDATLFYDGCTVRFSDQDFLSFSFWPWYNEPEVVLNNTNTVNPAAVASSFDVLVDTLMNKTAEHAAAASDAPQKKVATGEALFDGSDPQTKIYSLAQCTPDLTYGGCKNCLRFVMDEMALTRVPGAQGQRVAGVRCNVRFEVYPFYIGEAMVRIEGTPAPSPAPSKSRLAAPPAPPNPASPPSKGGIKNKIWLVAVSVSLVLLLCCILLAIIWTQSRRLHKRILRSQSQEVFPPSTEEAIMLWRMEEGRSELSMFEFSQVIDATNNFSEGNKLGEGGFGRVYKGQLPNGLEIAVKRLAQHSGQGLNEFKTEIHLIAKLQHTNLVRLLGYCIEGEEKILIYEYMSNKSLDFFIFDTTRGALLNWNRRRHIIEGVAQGLLYLHKHSRLRVIHRDLKASNILLDENMNPRISDFGLARIFGSNESHANTSRVVGTHGYMAPEYASEGQFSIKSDVFSFGVLLLEIISGKRNNGFHQTGNSGNLLGYVWLLWTRENWCELIDPCLDVKHPNMEIMRFINVGLMCVQDDAVDRPTISDAISLLMNESTSLPDPKKPAYFRNKGEDPKLEEQYSVNQMVDS
ncbi:hypothetical protein CFC21_016507 [Triticum aestivum]|uniref:non-specific serine/threonine protein kinase n=3 Tax=Triticum TaxID=4564 RepID=A0A9R1DZI7_WHEAT|nr:cysteine-rich receptor-like protein kinase 10 [Triticum urartu]KAF7000645.1 hypothetical protein CFC21_016507 [Triticum aestivum]